MSNTAGKLLTATATVTLLTLGGSLKHEALEAAESRHTHAPEQSPLPLPDVGQTRPVTINTTVSESGAIYIIGQPGRG
jgi:hypothetical protein